MSILSKNAKRFQRRRNRSKRPATGDLSRMRLVVFRSARHIYGQIINDIDKHTLVACSTVDKAIQAELKKAGSKIEQSQIVGKELAERALAKDINEIVFDRNGFIYSGRVKALADAARKSGLNF